MFQKTGAGGYAILDYPTVRKSPKAEAGWNTWVMSSDRFKKGVDVQFTRTGTNCFIGFVEDQDLDNDLKAGIFFFSDRTLIRAPGIADRVVGVYHKWRILLTNEDHISIYGDGVLLHTGAGNMDPYIKMGFYEPNASFTFTYLAGKKSDLEYFYAGYKNEGEVDIYELWNTEADWSGKWALRQMKSTPDNLQGAFRVMHRSNNDK